jgi:arylsulfatase A-like enzyme/Tfp pilus assembly protein PilF
MKNRKPRTRPVPPAAPVTPAAVNAAPRRRWSRWALAAVASAGVVAAALLLWRSAGHPGPLPVEKTASQNVLLITIDTLRADALSCYGGRARTPNLDRLAAAGLRFDRAHAHAVMTLPSHSSILTGLIPTQHGIHDNDGYRLPSTVPTLASRLKHLGFATGAFVGAFPVDSRFGLTTGFDVYDDHYPGTSGGREFSLPERRADAVIAAADTWIEAQKGKWFAWVHLFDPHAPYQPPAPFDREYGGSPYLGEVAWTDSNLPALLSAVLAASGGRPTLVIITADHGESLSEHGETSHGLFAYEATLHIPLIVTQLAAGTRTWDGTSGGSSPTPGRTVAGPVTHADIVPTVLDVLQAPADTTLPGRSLLGAGKDGTVGPTGSYFEALSASLNRGWAPLRGLIVGHEKYIDLPIPELYDLDADPAEAKNLATSSTPREQTLANLLKGVPGSLSVPGTRMTDADTSDRLRALGYVSGNAAPKAHYTEADDPKNLVAADQDIQRGVEMYHHGQLRETIPIYERLIAAHPSMEIAYSHLALVQWELGDPAAAVATLRRAMAAGVAGIGVRTKLGTYLAESGHEQQAVPLLQSAVTGEDPDLDALNALGIAYARTGRIDQATAAFLRVLDFSPAHAMALENLGSMALGSQDYAKARTWFTRALLSDPTSAQAHNGMGIVEMKAGNRDAAIEHWKQAVAKDPTNFYAIYNVGTELAGSGRTSEARPYLEQFARSAPPSFYAADIQRIRAILAQLDRTGTR